MGIGFFCFELMLVSDVVENIFSNKWVLIGWIECCFSSCFLVFECEVSEKEESLEKVIVFVWSGSGLRG